ncbi:MAG: DNA repair protein RecO [Brevinematales bacterium]|nr:DNA repair protein RecO [Brevinematales bacterium]
MIKKFRRISGMVLGTKDINEYDKMVVLFSPEIGKSNLMMYGGNSFKNRFSNRVNIANFIKGFVRYPSSSDKIPSLEEVDLLQNFFDTIKTRPFNLFAVNFITEVINILVPLEVFDEILYDTTIKSIFTISNSQSDDETFLTLSKFLISMLRLQGILPYIKEEKISEKTKMFIISIIKNKEIAKIDTETKLNFLIWFQEKLSRAVTNKRIVSIDLIKILI